MEKFSLYKDQQEVVDKCIAHINKPKNKPAVCVCPTSFGKSLVISELARVSGMKVLLLSPSIELLKQNHEKLLLLGGEASIYSAGANSKEMGNLTYATLGSVKNLGKDFKKLGVDLVIIDECDRGVPPAKSSMFSKFIKDLQPKSIIGFTATPFYNKSGGFGEGTSLRVMTRVRPRIFSEIIHVTQIIELIDAKRWTPVKYVGYEFDDNALVINSSGSDFTEESIREYNKVKGINNKIFLEVKGLVEKGYTKILVFCDSVETCKRFTEFVPNSAFVAGLTPKKERASIVENFKNGDLNVLFNYGTFCLDLETEVLTKEGWKRYNEISYTDKVANWEDGKVYYQEPISIVNRSLYESEYMVSYKSNHSNFRVTNTHNMLVSSNPSCPWRKVKCEELLKLKSGKHFPIHGKLCEIDKLEIPKDAPLKSSIKRRVAANSYNLRKNGMSYEESKIEALRRITEHDGLEYKNPHELTLPECFFIGFWLGDGSVTKTKNSGNRYSLSQSERYPIIIKKIIEVLKKIGINYSTSRIKPARLSSHHSLKWSLSTGTGFGPQKENGVYPLTPYLDKDGSKYLRGLNEDQLWELLIGFWYADGDHNFAEKVPNSLAISNTNLGLLTLLQELAVVRGISALVKVSNVYTNGYKTLYRLSVSKSLTKAIGYGKIKPIKEDYKPEQVWCVETQSGNIITRRNGIPLVMGNCVGYDHPELQVVIMGRATGSFSMYYQILGRLVRIHKDKKEALFLDWGGNVKRFGELDNVSIEDHEVNGWSLFSGDKLISGYTLGGVQITRQDLEASKNKSEKVRSNFIFEFGKWKGRPLHEIDRSYIEWLCSDKFEAKTPNMRQTIKICKDYLNTSKMEMLL